MSELGREARALLASARDCDDPCEQDRARMRRKLSVAIAAAAGSAAASAAAPAAAATKAGIGAQLAASAQAVAATGVSVKIGVAVTIAVIGVAGSGVVSTPREPAVVLAARAAPAVMAPRSPAPPALENTVGAEEPVARADDIAMLPSDVLPEAAAPVIVVPKPKRVASISQASKLPPERVQEDAPSIASELSLLSNAQAALRLGEPARALSLLDEHAARFPSGVLAIERDAARAIALCDAGRSDEGRAAARSLSVSMSSSPLAARVARACEP